MLDWIHLCRIRYTYVTLDTPLRTKNTCHPWYTYVVLDTFVSQNNLRSFLSIARSFTRDAGTQYCNWKERKKERQMVEKKMTWWEKVVQNSVIYLLKLFRNVNHRWNHISTFCKLVKTALKSEKRISWMNPRIKCRPHYKAWVQKKSDSLNPNIHITQWGLCRACA